jgi:hypothetical protein
MTVVVQAMNITFLIRTCVQYLLNYHLRFYRIEKNKHGISWNNFGRYGKYLYGSMFVYELTGERKYGSQ